MWGLSHPCVIEAFASTNEEMGSSEKKRFMVLFSVMLNGSCHVCDSLLANLPIEFFWETFFSLIHLLFHHLVAAWSQITMLKWVEGLHVEPSRHFCIPYKGWGWGGYNVIIINFSFSENEWLDADLFSWLKHGGMRSHENYLWSFMWNFIAGHSTGTASESDKSWFNIKF